MPFIQIAKIHSTRFYEFFEGGNIDTIATSPDKLVRRTNQTSFSDLRKSGIHKAFGEFVVHTQTVAPQWRALFHPADHSTYLLTTGSLCELKVANSFSGSVKNARAPLASD